MIELGDKITLNVTCLQIDTNGYTFAFLDAPIKQPFRIELTKTDKENDQRIHDFFEQAKKL